MPSMHVNGPILTAASYRQGMYADGPIDHVNNAQYTNLALDFNSAHEIVIGAGGPWVAGLDIGAPTTPTIAVAVNSVAAFDPGTVANTGKEWHLGNAINDAHLNATDPGQDCVLSARLFKVTSADTFGCVSLSGLAGIASVLSTTGIINTVGNCRAAYIAINGSGTISGGINNLSVNNSASYTDRNFALGEVVDVAIVGKKLKFTGGSQFWTSGSFSFYARGKKFHQVNALGTAWSSGALNPTVSVVNGAATTGQTRLDYINWTVTRGVTP